MRGALLLAAALAGGAWAAPETSPRPPVRPAAGAEAASDRPAVVGMAAPRGETGPSFDDGATPVPGDDATLVPGDEATLVPGDEATLVPADEATPVPGDEATPVPGDGAAAPGASVGPLASSIRPEARPPDIAARARSARAAVAAPPRMGARDASVRRAVGPVGALCGSRAILGEPLAPIPGRLRGCGVAEPMRVMAVSGVRLSRPAVMDCRTARVLAGWVEGAVRPAIGDRGGGVVGLQVAAGYQCRTRNHRPGAPISEHGRGRAIDISAFLLADGGRITVLEGWRRRGEGRILRAVHAAACGPFGTVLGPESDRFHQDHFHLDTAPRRATAYCR